MAVGDSSLFDLKRILQSSLGKRLRFFESIESTNTLALELARDQNLACPQLLLAEHQSAGRGRGSNRWWSSHGALTFTLLLEPPADFARLHWPKMALATAVAISRTVKDVVPDSTPGIRWPNDVFVAQRKVSGVLVEVPSLAAHAAQRVVIGIGLNVNNSLKAAPADVQARATSLADLSGTEHTLTEVLLQLLANIEHDLARLYAHSPDLVDDWQRLCLLRGRRITLEQGPHTVVGACQGVAVDGSLIIDAGRGIERFYAGVLKHVE